MDVKTARENYRELCVRLTTAALTGSIERLARGIRVEDTRLAQDETRPGGVLARIYEPSSGDVGAVAMYVHGGGWRVGDLDSEDRKSGYTHQISFPDQARGMPPRYPVPTAGLP